MADYLSKASTGGGALNEGDKIELTLRGQRGNESVVVYGHIDSILSQGDINSRSQGTNISALAASASGSPYDSIGALTYVVAVIVVYSISMFLIVATYLRRKSTHKSLDGQVNSYIKGLEQARLQAKVDNVLRMRLRWPGNFIHFGNANKPDEDDDDDTDPSLSSSSSSSGGSSPLTIHLSDLQRDHHTDDARMKRNRRQREGTERGGSGRRQDRRGSGRQREGSISVHMLDGGGGRSRRQRESLGMNGSGKRREREESVDCGRRLTRKSSLRQAVREAVRGTRSRRVTEPAEGDFPEESEGDYIELPATTMRDKFQETNSSAGSGTEQGDSDKEGEDKENDKAISDKFNAQSESSEIREPSHNETVEREGQEAVDTHQGECATLVAAHTVITVQPLGTSMHTDDSTPRDEEQHNHSITLVV